MRKTLAIALLAFSLAMITANSLAKRVLNFLHPQAKEEKVEETFFPFGIGSDKDTNYIKVYNIDEEPALEEQYTVDGNLKQAKEYVAPVLKVGLTEEEKQTIAGYAKNDKLKDFIKEISGVISQDDLKQGNYLQVAYNPQVRSIFEKYAKDEELNLQPGHAYFITRTDNPDEINSRLKYEVMPLIKEYIMDGMLSRAKDDFVSYFRKRINTEMFN